MVSPFILSLTRFDIWISVEMLRLMTQGVGPSEEDYLDDNERRRLENERALDAPKAKLRKKNDAESSTKPKKTSKPNPKEKSQTDSIIDLAAPISNVQESSSETGGPTPQTRKVVRPKPKPRGKNANVPESSTKKPEPNPEGNKMEKSQTHLLDCNRTDVDKATTSQSPRECKISLHFTMFILLNSHDFHASYPRSVYSENTSCG